MVKQLTLIARDSWDRPVYRDEEGKLWKDTDCRKGWQGHLYSPVDDEFDGESDWSMDSEILCKFIPERITD